MSAAVIDLRSDFVARPTPEMIAFAGQAALRDAAFQPWEDPLVQELTALGAGLLGRSHASFTINCTTANYLALSQHARAFDRLVLARDSHIVRHEHVLLQGIRTGQPPVVADDAVGAAAGLLAQGGSLLLAVENTELYRCGRPLDCDDLERLRALKQAAGGRLGLHLDGSRLFNAQAAMGYDLTADFALFDSIAISLNKGLAAPIGALLVGGRDLVDAAYAQAAAEARVVRPAHIPAAYALMALRQTQPDLAHDNRRAALLAAGLRDRLRARGAPSPLVDYGGSNILFLAWPAEEPATRAVARLAARGILVRRFRDPSTVRLVFHRDIDDACLARLEPEILAACLSP